MTTLVPREPYTADELHRLYPKELALQQVQVVSRSRAQLPIRFVILTSHSSSDMVRLLSQSQIPNHLTDMERRTITRLCQI